MNQSIERWEDLMEDAFFLLYYGKLTRAQIMKLTPCDRAWLINMVAKELL